ncbi:hypothetical protein [Neorhizobium sp. DAR64872/K0K18]|uniref:hypothetical protein n=1 Tax=Neorhizobium sp. DAR64872/K0K18 TaxID=3421958 RepID=UPI003D2E2E54
MKATAYLAAILLAAFPAMADDRAPALEAFLTLCLATGPHYDQVLAASKSKQWTPLAADMAMAFTPVRDPSSIEGWLLEGREDHPFEALVTFKAKVSEKAVEGCTAAVSSMDGPLVERQIVDPAAAKPAGEEQSDDSTYKRFSAKIDGRDNAITVTVPRYPKGSDQVVVSVVAVVAVDN